MIIKVCGMRDGANIREVAALGVDWIGMIFYPKSPRYVRMIPSGAGIIPDRAAEGEASLLEKVKRVGVFVDDMPQNIVTRAYNYHLDLIQLHGHETPTLIRNLRATLDPDIRPGVKLMKVLSVASQADIERWRRYDGHADYLLFDTRCDEKGGSGWQFDWSVLDAYDGSIPFLLSGGIGPDDAERVLAFRHPQCIGIDLNSKFEVEPGVKDVQKLAAFIKKLKMRN